MMSTVSGEKGPQRATKSADLGVGLIIGFFLAVGWVSSFLLHGLVQGPKKLR